MTSPARELEDALGADDRPPLSRRAVPRALLAPATASGLLRYALEEWAMLLALWTVAAWGPGWVYWLALLPLAGRFHALGVVLHDAAHLPLQRKTAPVRAVELLCGYPIASTLNAMRYHHLRHHRDAGMVTDPYFKGGRQDAVWWLVNVLRGLLLVPFWSARALVGAAALALPSLRRSYARVFLQDRGSEDPRDSAEVRECAHADLGQLAFQALVLGAWVVAAGPIVYGYLVPVSLAGVFAARRLLLEHRYERVSDRSLATIVSITNDNHLGWLGALGFAPRNIGYHIVHHLHPQAGLRALPALRDSYLVHHPGLYPARRA